MHQTSKVSGHTDDCQGVEFASVFMTFLLDFGTVLTVWLFWFSV